MFDRRLVLVSLALSFLVSKATLSDDNTSQRQNFFPKQIFSENKKIDDLVRDWYSKQLNALEEPSLYPPKQNLETYRFTWLRTFHNPMVFRISVLEDGSGILRIKRCNGAGGYEPGVTDLRKEIKLTNLQVHDLNKKLEEMDFWQKPTNLDSKMMDGAEWIVEANLDGKYKIVIRKTDTDNLIKEWGLQLIKLSGVDVGEIY